jgi:hypothetical protein
LFWAIEFHPTKTATYKVCKQHWTKYGHSISCTSFTENEMETLNRPDEWKIEQGLSGAKLPILDQTGRETITIQPQKWGKLVKDEEAIKAVGDPNKLFVRELEGWKGYVVLSETGPFLRQTFPTS